MATSFFRTTSTGQGRDQHTPRGKAPLQPTPSSQLSPRSHEDTVPQWGHMWHSPKLRSKLL